MPETGLAVFDTTIQATNEWLNELMDELDVEDKHHAYSVLRATLHALRDRLPPDEAAHLGAQLPMLVRGFYYEGWRPSGTHPKERSKAAFLDHIASELREPAGDVEPAVRAVFRLLLNRVSTGEVIDVQLLLPAGVRDLWP